MKSALILVVLSLFASSALAANWAVLVAGSDGWWNYRHQADVCHAYQTLIAKGMKPEHIIVMQKDDIANARQNPFPGQIFNKPSPNAPGVDVYAGCGKDYTGASVTPANFLAILSGNKAGVQGGNGRVLETGPNDNVFVFFSDHGASGMICFPNQYLYANDLISTMKKMYAEKRYKEFVFYLEACESGSMFEGLLDNNMNIFVTTAANAHESSWGCYCGGEAVINGKSIGSCLGDLYSVNWMEDTDKKDIRSYTLQQQFETVRTLTTRSHVMAYGQNELSVRNVAEFQSAAVTLASFAKPRSLFSLQAPYSTLVDSRDAKLQYLYHSYINAPRDTKLSSSLDLTAEIEHRSFADNAFNSLASIFFPTNGASSILAMPVLPRNFECLKASVDATEQACGKFSDYSLKYVKVLTFLCENDVPAERIAAASALVCETKNYM